MSDLKTAIFKTAADGLMAQGQKSLNADGECTYRGGGEGELRCGIGFLIDNVTYLKLDLEGNSAADLLIQEAIAMTMGVQLDEIISLEDLLVGIQEVHDNAHPLNWGVELNNLAADHDVNWSTNV